MANEPASPPALDPRLTELPRNPRDYLSVEEKRDLAETLESISRTRREAEASSGDLRMC
jgi:hypothetical protein